MRSYEQTKWFWMLTKYICTLWVSSCLLPHVTKVCLKKMHPFLLAGYKQKENIAVAKKIAFFLFKQNGGTVHNKQFAIVVAVVPVCPSVYSLKRQCQHWGSLQDQWGRGRGSSGTFSVGRQPKRDKDTKSPQWSWRFAASSNCVCQMQTVKYSKFKTLFRLADKRRRSSFSFTVMRSPPSPFGFIFAQRNEQEEAEKK